MIVRKPLVKQLVIKESTDNQIKSIKVGLKWNGKIKQINSFTTYV